MLKVLVLPALLAMSWCSQETKQYTFFEPSTVTGASPTPGPCGQITQISISGPSTVQSPSGTVNLKATAANGPVTLPDTCFNGTAALWSLSPSGLAVFQGDSTSTQVTIKGIS